MFTQSLSRSRLLDLLLGPHGVDRYTELVDPMWTTETRATVVAVRHDTPGSVTVRLAPNRPVDMRAGQYLPVTVEIDGRRHTRCYSPANAQGDPQIELTVSRHDGGRVSGFLHRHARPGMVVGLGAPAGEFVLPDPRPRRILLIAGGSGITPVMAIVRTLAGEGYDGDIAVLHYVPTLADACYRAELAALPGVRVHYSCTRGDSRPLRGHLRPEHLAQAMPAPDAVYACGPATLVESVRAHRTDVIAESFTAPSPAAPGNGGGGRVTFADSGIDVVDDGRALLEQAETAGLSPQSGCRMGICHTCTRRKTRGRVRNLRTGAVSGTAEDEVQICVSVPIGDVEIAL